MNNGFGGPQQLIELACCGFSNFDDNVPRAGPRWKLSLGEVQPRPRALLAMDLTHVNQSLALKGEAPVDVIISARMYSRRRLQ